MMWITDIFIDSMDHLKSSRPAPGVAFSSLWLAESSRTAAAAEMQNLLLVPPDALISHSAKRQSRQSVSADRSTQTTADAAPVTEGRARKERNAQKGLKASHFACEAHDRQTVEDAVKSLRRCGVRVVRVVRVVHAAPLRVQVA